MSALTLSVRHKGNFLDFILKAWKASLISKINVFINYLKTFRRERLNSNLQNLCFIKLYEMSLNISINLRCYFYNIYFATTCLRENDGQYEPPKKLFNYFIFTFEF